MQEVDTLLDINVKINKGEKVAVLGRNGSGKTTLVKLACGLFGCSDGIVMYDGVDTKQIHNDDLSRSIGIVLQDVQLFSGSIIENITMGREGISQEDIVDAAKITGLDDFLGKVPGGYEMVLQDKGNGLSGGQRQAIAITRAIVHKPSHFIFDEPTSAMDMNSEQYFIKNFQESYQDSTLIVVSHRMPLVNLVDRIIVMSDGKIIDDGPRDEIIKKLQGQT
jgi:ATP-binding cassette subfamily C protein LapB